MGLRSIRRSIARSRGQSKPKLSKATLRKRFLQALAVFESSSRRKGRVVNVEDLRPIDRG